MSNLPNTVLYVGVSSDLYSRVYDHRNKTYPNSLTSKYNCVKLVYYQQFTTIEEAIDREKQLKNWRRAWKINLINDFNPGWKDLSDLV